MNNILLVGNGFDIAHGLKTGYNDFLYFMKNWRTFYSELDLVKKSQMKHDDTTVLKEYAPSIEMLNDISVSRFDEIIKSNLWVNYYCNCNAEMDGWVDFEKELVPVIQMFEKLFRMDTISASEKVMGFERFLQNHPDNKYSLDYNYRIGFFKPKKKTILKELREQFDEFIFLLELYLYEFIYKRDDIKPLRQVDDIGIDYMISLNYTLTEGIYHLSENKVHHIHGNIRKQWGTRTSNMVLGIDEEECPNIDFIYFVKYFQRIQKRVGTLYKEFIEKTHKNEIGEAVKDEYILHIYGHSLDKTDKDVLLYLIGDYEHRRIAIKPQKVVIYYYDQDDYERKVVNLISIYGRDVVEHCIEYNKFEFTKTDN